MSPIFSVISSKKHNLQYNKFHNSIKLFMAQKRKTRVACFASGEGTNFSNLIQKSANKNYVICLLISNNSKSGVMERAKNHNVDSYHISSMIFDDPAKEMLSVLKKNEIDVIALCGYMKKIDEKLLLEFKDRILNIHPSLLPKYGGQGMYGSKVHKAVFDNKEKESGATIHLVNEEYDKGRILLQKSIPINSNDGPDDISEKVRKIEFEIYPIALNEFCEGLSD